MPNLNTARFVGEEDLPNLEQHNNHMAHVLTLDLYNNLRGKETEKYLHFFFDLFSEHS